uniref:RING-type domain-containing protein n=1 Tax=Calcidiscus leptoporus TaxID=127549 RepID=A0A7S0NN36_9EUKA|mmetsp:Transcript_11533/g.26624  ORF Transcript_11533/g.26624 Transcript_11533/m.26624 type:complete len:128 (+) Transcript_11533:188-571(+)
MVRRQASSHASQQSRRGEGRGEETPPPQIIESAADGSGRQAIAAWPDVDEDDATDASAAAKTLCTVCLERGSSHAFVPCGHQAVCNHCATRKWTACPVCRAPSQLVIRIFVVGQLRSASDVPVCASV